MLGQRRAVRGGFLVLVLACLVNQQVLSFTATSHSLPSGSAFRRSSAGRRGAWSMNSDSSRNQKKKRLPFRILPALRAQGGQGSLDPAGRQESMDWALKFVEFDDDVTTCEATENMTRAVWTCSPPASFAFYYDKEERHLILEGEAEVTVMASNGVPAGPVMRISAGQCVVTPAKQVVRWHMVSAVTKRTTCNEPFRMVANGWILRPPNLFDTHPPKPEVAGAQRTELLTLPGCAVEELVAAASGSCPLTISLQVADLQVAERFYVGLLGMRVVRRQGQRIVVASSGKEDPQVLFEVAEAQPRPEGEGSAEAAAAEAEGVLSVACADVAGLVRRIEAAGQGEVLVKAGGRGKGLGSVAAVVRDPSGITVQVLQRSGTTGVRLLHALVSVGERRRALAFYQQLLGMQLHRTVIVAHLGKVLDLVGYGDLTRQASCLALVTDVQQTSASALASDDTPSSPPAPPANRRLSFSCQELSQLAAALQERGVDVEQGQGWCGCRDADGNRIEFVQP